MIANLRMSYTTIIKYFSENGVCPCEYMRLIYNLVSKIRRKVGHDTLNAFNPCKT